MRLIQLAIISLGILLVAGCTGGNSKPNVVLIIIDTLRADKMGVYGNKQNLTPELDVLAQSGLRFGRAISQSSWTRTSIGSFLTSQYPRTLGIFKEQWDVLPKHFTTLAEVLQQAGYQTVGVTANPNINSTFNFDQGFDVYVDSNVIFPWMKSEEGKTRATKNIRLPKANDIYGRAIDEIRTIPKNKKPIYLQINIMDVHGWSDIPEDSVDADLQSDPAARYLHAVRMASRATSEFVSQLSAMPEFKNTLFVVLSDHGEGLYDHPDVPDTLRHGNVLYESQVHVPWFMFNPSDQSLRRVVERQVRLLDLLPTLLDYIGIQAPKGIQGVSLMPLARGNAQAAVPRFAFTETEWKKVSKVAVYSDEAKYFENRDDWPGVLPQELQAIGPSENGLKTDLGSAKPELKEALKQLLQATEHPILRQESVQVGEDPSAEEIEQLKSLGYLG
jgi:arylsulfatase A-like enzyme